MSACCPRTSHSTAEHAYCSGGRQQASGCTKGGEGHAGPRLGRPALAAVGMVVLARDMRDMRLGLDLQAVLSSVAGLGVCTAGGVVTGKCDAGQ